jgi:hypothetical protein
MKRNLLLVGMLMILAVSAGCSNYTPAESATPTESTAPAESATPTASASPTESPPQLKIRTDSTHNVAVTISENPDNGSELVNETFTVRPGETLQFDETLAETARYDVSVRVESGDSWNRTVAPGDKYVVRINADGEIQVAL